MQSFSFCTLVELLEVSELLNFKALPSYMLNVMCHFADAQLSRVEWTRTTNVSFNLFNEFSILYFLPCILQRNSQIEIPTFFIQLRYWSHFPIQILPNTKTAHNTGLAKARFPFSKSTFVVCSNSVILLNFCG